MPPAATGPVHDGGVEGDLLDRETYTARQVDTLLGLTPGTAERWIDGYERGGKQYAPVVRETSSGVDVVTWGEFVECKLLSAYRSRRVPMLRMRPAVVRLRELFEVRYPLAHVRPYVYGRDLVYGIQDEVGLDSQLRLVVARNGQYVLTDAAEAFVETVEFEGGLVVRVRPLGTSSPVTIDPLRQFGAPVVRSVPTEVIAELVRAGDPEEAIAELYDLRLEDVRAAIRFELVRQAA